MNKVALITGASRGLGRSMAHFLAGQGNDLILTARGEDDLHSVANELASMDTQVHVVAGDVSKAAARRGENTARDYEGASAGERC